jgi:hypothetical protein
MIGHEIAGVLVATIILVAFVTAVSPNSQMGNILTSSASGWSQILNTAAGAGFRGANG